MTDPRHHHSNAMVWRVIWADALALCRWGEIMREPCKVPCDLCVAAAAIELTEHSLEVTCPVCAEPAHRPCRSMSSGRALEHPHTRRLKVVAR